MVRSEWLYLGFLALLGLERLVELAISRRNAARALARGGVEVGQGHFRVMAAIHTAFLASCAAEVLLLHRPFPGTIGWVALAGALLAQGLRYWAILTLGDRWNVRIVFVPGEAPITSGPYRFVRHPNYVAVCLELLCVPLIHGAWCTALVFGVANLAILRVRIRAEEAALGGPYLEALGDRPRFLPGARR